MVLNFASSFSFLRRFGERYHDVGRDARDGHFVRICRKPGILCCRTANRTFPRPRREPPMASRTCPAFGRPGGPVSMGSQDLSRQLGPATGLSGVVGSGPE
jgi:hypothetical protein